MKALLILGIFASGMVACSDGGKDTQAVNEEPAKPKRAKLTALSETSSSSRPKKPSTSVSSRPANEITSSGSRQVVLPPDIQNDPEALARREEVRQKAAIAREEAEARRTEERAERVAQMTEQFSTRLREMDANGDGFLAKEEVSGPLERRFDASDTNSDGYLDAEEQAAIFASISERMSAASTDGRGGRRGFGAGGGAGFGNSGGGRGQGRQGRGGN